MEEWNRDILINLLDSLIDYRGKTPKKTSSGVPLVTAKIIKGGRILPFEEFIAEDNYDSWMVRGLPQPGDVVLTTEAPLGEVAQLDNTKVALAQRVVTLRGKKGILDNTYLKYFLQSDIGQKRLIARETGTTVTGIKQSELRKVEISYPDFDTQCRIASILKSLDDKIALNNRINHNLEEQAQALYKSWFVDFEPFKDGMFVDSELGMIPEGWRVGTVNEIMDIQSGFPFKSRSFVERGQYLLITIKAVQDGQLTISGADSLDVPLPSKMPNYCNLNVGDILLSLTGNVGRVCIVDRDGLLLNQRVAKMAPKKEYNRAYTYFLARNEKFKESMYQIARGTAQLNLSPVETGNLQIVIPPSDVLVFFSRIATPLFKSITATLREMISLQSSRDVLLPQLISGQLTC